MRGLALLGILFLLAAAAGAARPCQPGWYIGLQYVAFPVEVPTPGGHMASGAYIDDRSFQCPLGPVDCNFLLGAIGGDGTWFYFETNGVPGLQRGGHSSLPTTPLTGENDSEFAACAGANPDELVL
ncbi:MAG: hypothetical protein LC624_06075 [Halobacteriales archaeon]|nr:hypothetical protein [Halobacteriales archaeon]